MNIRQLLFVHNLNDTKLAKINSWTFAAIFFFFRLLFQIAFLFKSLPWLINELQNHVHTNYSSLEIAGYYFCFAA
jgi:hypothetical protein